MPPTVKARLNVEKVTYLTLTPDVKLTAFLETSGDSGGKAFLEFSIVELTENRTYGRRNEELDLTSGTQQCEIVIPVQSNRMMGLLAQVKVLDPVTQQVLAVAQRPFDITNDLRTNFRYAGETYANVEKKLPHKALVGDGHTDMDFWDPIPVGGDPKEMIDSLYDCFQNVAQVSVEEDRGHITCWEEGNRKFWGKSAYHADAFWLFSLDRIKYLYNEGTKHGVYMMPWTDHKGARIDYFPKDFPWIDHNNPHGYYAGVWLMNLDPNYRRPLTPEELKMSKWDLHGAASWLEYAVEELYRASVFYNTYLMWWDNSYGGAHIPYTLDMLRKKWAEQRSDVAPPLLMINGFAGYHSDVIWIEYPMPPRIQDYIRFMHQLVVERPEVKNGAATLSFGQVHPDKRSGQQSGITDPKNVYNDPNYTHIYRQLLFECVASEAKLVYQQQWPRNALEWRIKHFPEAFQDHAKTWGFLTQFEHVYNSRDIIPYPLADSVKAVDVPTTCGDFAADDQLHLVARSSILNPEIIYLHLFNYRGTTADSYKSRPRPIPQEKVTIHMNTPSFSEEYTVRAFSPDFKNYGDCIEPKPQYKSNEMEFSVPVDTYTLIVVKRRWI